MTEICQKMQSLAIMRSIKIKFFVLIFSLLMVYLFLFYFFLEKWFNRKTEPAIHSSVIFKYVVVHLDLKGSPPKLKYLESLLPMLKDYEVNGLLVEYEDMFPYEGKLVNISSKNCYDRNELKKFLNWSVRFGIEIIPLVQTFGHMEHALKLQEFRHLRESPKFPDSICPSKAGSIRLINEMLTQVINFHASIIPLKHFHIGCDEVYHINKCDHCRHKNITSMDLFYRHIHEVDTTIKKLSPHTTVLFWDDMLRGRKGLRPASVDIANLEPVYWDYKKRLSVSHANLLNYHRKFKNIWIASAFKGADGRTAMTPNLNNRFINNLAWLNLIVDYKFGGENEVHNFKGIILTGWSRYSHMDPLCELLPVSIPSLIINLILLQKMKNGVVINDPEIFNSDDFFAKYLKGVFNKGCNYLVEVDGFNSEVCLFEYYDIYNHVQLYNKVNNKIQDRYTNDDTILSSIEYYSQTRNINMNTVQIYMRWCNDNLKRLSDFEAKMRHLMSVYYEKDVVDEYVSYKTYDTKRKLWATLKILKQYLKTQAWERRSGLNNITMILN